MAMLSRLIHAAAAILIASTSVWAAGLPAQLRNPLVYPGTNILPGFNPSHFAAGKNIRFSGVATGGLIPTSFGCAFLRLDQGGKSSGATCVSPIQTLILPFLGPVIANSNAGNAYMTFPGLNETPTAVTMAAIIQVVASNTSAAYIFDNNAGGSGTIAQTELVTLAGTTTLGIGVANVPVSCGITLTTAVPYFVVTSYNGTTLNCVVRNLKTGIVTTGITSSSHTIGTTAAGAYYFMGPNTTNVSNFRGYLAAMMYSINYFLSIQQETLWADKPWDFWYPATQQGIMFLSAKGTGVSPGQCPSLPMVGWGC